MGAIRARARALLIEWISMSAHHPRVVAISAAARSDNLVSPAIKAIMLGFVGGVIALLALTMLAPHLMQFDDMGQAKTATRIR